MPRRKRRSEHAFAQHDTVRSTPILPSDRMFTVPKRHKEHRKPDTPGHVAGQIGDVFLVLHVGDSVSAVYQADELIFAHDGYWAVEHTTTDGILYRKEVRTHSDAEGYCETLRESGVEPTLEGPFFADKELAEGIQETRNLFDHLTDE